MARGWGRSEEDLEADKQEQRERARLAQSGSRDALQEAARRRGIELSLANVEQQLASTASPARRAALEAAKRDLIEKLGSAADEPASR